MREVIYWSKTQLLNFGKIIYISNFDKKAANQSNFLGILWEFLSPALQIIIYYIIFGIRLNGKIIAGSDVPFIYWMMCGAIPWFDISSSIISGASSIYTNINLIAKTHFPIEILPTIAVVKGLTSFFSMISIFLIVYISSGNAPTFSWLQLIYYFFSMFLLLLSVGVITSVITVIFRDFQLIISSLMRLLFFISGVVVNVIENSESLLFKLFKLNPFLYIIEGFRDAIFSRGWFFDQPFWMMYFWTIVLLILIMGIYLFNRYKDEFVEYM